MKNVNAGLKFIAPSKNNGREVLWVVKRRVYNQTRRRLEFETATIEGVAQEWKYTFKSFRHCKREGVLKVVGYD